MVKVLLGVVCLFFTVTAAAAQVPTGTISGHVVSSDEAPLPGVTVTATSPNLQGERTVVTSANGDFVIPPGVAHWFSAVESDMNYLVVRIDPQHVLPAGYVNPAIARSTAR